MLYCGVISEITPPVGASAYAPAGIAGANPFHTGVSAFTLGIGKLMVPMVFVYAPTMLIVLPEHLTLVGFLQVALTCAFGIFAIATAVTGFFRTNLGVLSRIVMAVAGRFLVAPSLNSDILALLIAAPVVLLQVLALRRETPEAAAAD